jgi:hypothetical protein
LGLGPGFRRWFRPRGRAFRGEGGRARAGAAGTAGTLRSGRAEVREGQLPESAAGSPRCADLIP